MNVCILLAKCIDCIPLPVLIALLYCIHVLSVRVYIVLYRFNNYTVIRQRVARELVLV